MSTHLIHRVEGDLAPFLFVELVGIDITGWTIKLLGIYRGTFQQISIDHTVDDAAAGQFHFEWGATDLVKGIADFEIDFLPPTGDRFTIPAENTLLLKVRGKTEPGKGVLAGGQTIQITEDSRTINISGGGTGSISGTIKLGTPTDGTYTDGLFPFTETTQVNDAIDDLNEFLAAPVFDGNVVFAGGLGTSVATIWDLLDDDPAALSFDTPGHLGLLVFDTTDGLEQVRIGNTAASADFPNARAIASQGDTGRTSTNQIGLLGEALATVDAAVGVYGIGKTSVGSLLANGMVAVGTVTATTDLGTAVGITALSMAAHSGGDNVGGLFAAANGANNYAIKISIGDILSQSALDWELADNIVSALSFDAPGLAGILDIDTTDGAERVTMAGGLLVVGEITSPGAGATSEKFGLGAVASETQNVAFGFEAVASGVQATAVGASADATGSAAVAIGTGSNAMETQSTAVGVSARADGGSNPTALGASATASGAAVAVGRGAIAAGASVAVGHNASTVGFQGAVALGRNALVQFTSGMAIGEGANVVSSATNSIALGRSAVATVARQWRTGSPTHYLDEMSIIQGLNAQETRIKTVTTELTVAADATASGLIPAGAIPIGVTTRVTTAITGATGYDAGDGVDQDAWGANIAVALGTTSDNTDWTGAGAAVPLNMYPAANDLVLTPIGGAFTAGVVRVTVHYIDVIAPTS